MSEAVGQYSVKPSGEGGGGVGGGVGVGVGVGGVGGGVGVGVGVGGEGPASGHHSPPQPPQVDSELQYSPRLLHDVGFCPQPS